MLPANKFHVHGLLHAVCTFVSLIADTSIKFVVSTRVVASSDDGSTGSATTSSATASVLSFLLLFSFCFDGT